MFSFFLIVFPNSAKKTTKFEGEMLFRKNLHPQNVGLALICGTIGHRTKNIEIKWAQCKRDTERKKPY